MTNSLYGDRGFSLVEALIVVSVIAVIATLVIVSIAGTADRASTIVARQQQAELQSALGAWIASAASGSNGLAGARQRYNDEANKLSLLSDYLQTDTFARLSNSGTEVDSTALSESRAKLYFSARWEAGDVPSVTWSNN